MTDKQQCMREQKLYWISSHFSPSLSLSLSLSLPLSLSLSLSLCVGRFSFFLLSAQSVLYQRFLENDGELGRGFTKAFNKFTEFHQAIAEQKNKPPSAAASEPPSTTVSNPSAAPTPSPVDMLESLTRELHAYAYGVKHARLIQANALVEMKSYEEREAEIGQSTDRIKNDH